MVVNRSEHCFRQLLQAAQRCNKTFGPVVLIDADRGNMVCDVMCCWRFKEAVSLIYRLFSKGALTERPDASVIGPLTETEYSDWPKK